MTTWPIYVFGDTQSYWTALNGLAAYFSNSNMTNSAAYLGSLIALTFIVFGFATYSTDMGKTMRMWGSWGALVIFTLMPVRVQIQNVYTAQFTAVDNVPAIIAIPASVFTNFGWDLTQSLDTAFQGVSGSYLTVSQNGLMGPLQIYLALMNDSFAAQQDPYMYRNVQQVLTDCSLGGSIVRGVPAAGGVPTLDTSQDILAYLNDNLRKTGITTNYSQTNPTGVSIACGDAIASIQTGMNNFLTGKKYSSMQSVATGKTKNTLGQANSFNDYSSVFSTWAGSQVGIAQTAQQQAQAMLISRTVDYTLECLSENGQIASGKTCEIAAELNADNILGLAANNIENGSGWNKMLYTTISVMQYLFFALAPIVLLVVLIFPMHAPKIFIGYIFFGLFVSTMLIFSAPMSYYIQSQIVDTINATQSSSGGLNIANYAQFRNKMMQSLSFASSMIAETPVIAAAILSGSYYGLNSFASSLAGGHSGPEVIQPTAFSQAPLTQTSPTRQVNSNTGLGIATGATTATIQEVVQKSTGISSQNASSIAKAKVSRSGVTISNTDGTSTQVSVSDINQFSEGFQRNTSEALNASGLAMSKFLAANTGFTSLKDKIKSQNPGVTDEQAAAGITADVFRRAQLNDKTGTFAARMSGEYGANDAEKKSNKEKAEKELLSTYQMAVAGDASMLAGSAVTIAAEMVGEAEIFGTKPGPGVGKVTNAVLGKLEPRTTDTMASAYGHSRGLSKSEVVARTVGASLISNISAENSETLQNTGSFSVSGAELASSSFTSSKDVQSVASDFNQNQEAKELYFKRSQLLDPKQYQSTLKSYGLESPDKVLEGALVQAFTDGKVQFNQTQGKGIAAQSNQGFVGTVSSSVGSVGDPFNPNMASLIQEVKDMSDNSGVNAPSQSNPAFNDNQEKFATDSKANSVGGTSILDANANTVLLNTLKPTQVVSLGPNANPQVGVAGGSSAPRSANSKSER